MAKREHLCARSDCPIHRAEEEPDEDAMDIHTYFNLTYANYLVIPRTLLQSMDEGWQERFVRLLNELNEAFDYIERADAYRVTPYDPTTGKFAKEPVPHYNRGRTHIEPFGNREEATVNN